MSLETAKRLACRILGCGESRVRVYDAKKASEALTAEDVRGLIMEGVIACVAKKGVGRGKSIFKQSRKESGRRRGQGSNKGEKFSKETRKQRWMKKVRAQRKILSAAKARLPEGEHRKIYSMVKGNYFKSKKQLSAHIAETSKK
ncbi:MAG: 50S ribosomal protein L19e [Candidatus Micrarchaeia archaeon]|jgi:large subunit ribosomal protein L19e